MKITHNQKKKQLIHLMKFHQLPKRNYQKIQKKKHLKKEHQKKLEMNHLLIQIQKNHQKKRVK